MKVQIAMENLVSIITPCYNSADFLVDCIESVLSQTFPSWEMLIVDDCSEDESRQIIERYAASDPRVKPVFLTGNVGPAEARNIAIRRAKSRFIAFLDSDDLWLPRKLERQLEFMKDTGVAFSFTSYETITEDGDRILNRISVPPSIGYRQYLRNTIIGCLTVIVDRHPIGSFEMPNIRSSHDMALWLRIMKRGFLAYGLNESLAKYRLVSSSNTSKKLRAVRDVWSVYRQEENLGLAYSLYNLGGYAFHAIKKRL